MEAKPRWLTVLDFTTAGIMLIATALVFFYAPEEAVMGQVQRVFYFHVSAVGGWSVGCFGGGRVVAVVVEIPLRGGGVRTRGFGHVGIFQALSARVAFFLGGKKSLGIRVVEADERGEHGPAVERA